MFAYFIRNVDWGTLTAEGEIYSRIDYISRIILLYTCTHSIEMKKTDRRRSDSAKAVTCLRLKLYAEGTTFLLHFRFFYSYFLWLLLMATTKS